MESQIESAILAIQAILLAIQAYIASRLYIVTRELAIVTKEYTNITGEIADANKKNIEIATQMSESTKQNIKLTLEGRHILTTIDIHREFSGLVRARTFVTGEGHEIVNKARISGDFSEIKGEERIQILQVASFYERLGSLVDHHFVDENLIFDLIGQSILDAWNSTRPFLLHLRRESEDSRRYENFEFLAELYGEYKSIRRAKFVPECVESHKPHLKREITGEYTFEWN